MNPQFTFAALVSIELWLVFFVALPAIAAQTKIAQTQTAQTPTVLVSTQTPAQGSIPDTLIAYGTAVPKANGGITLSVQSDGRVLALFVTPGEAVHSRERLLDFEISAAALSTYEQATSTLKLAREEQTRIT